MEKKYTWDDIIINPNDKRLEGAIGKEVYFDSFPLKCLNKANQNEDPRELLSISSLKQSITPFNVRFEAINTVCIILKKEPPYEERQAQWLEDNGLETGDKVKVIRLWTDDEARKEMCVLRFDVPDEIIGEVVEILEIRSTGIKIDHKGVCWCLPYFVLKKVTPKYVPFDFSKEEDRNMCKGRWVVSKDKEESQEILVKQFHYEKSTKDWRMNGCSSRFWLDNYTFDDGTPVGKEVWE